MEKSKTSYRHIKHFLPKKNQLIKDKKSFTIVSTTYTKKIIGEGRKVFFNTEGKSNDMLLALINRVRSDAAAYQLRCGSISNTPIDFYKLMSVPEESEVITKVDVRAAYWTTALKAGIISEETDALHKKIYEHSEDEEGDEINVRFEGQTISRNAKRNQVSKGARLKALGSLATTRITQEYRDGEPYGLPTVETQGTKDVYMEVCRIVDQLMKRCAAEVEGCVYYYWDCVFMKKNFAAEAVEFFRRSGFDVRCSDTKIEFVPINDSLGYLLSTYDDKIYMTRREDRHLLEKIKSEYRKEQVLAKLRGVKKPQMVCN